MRGVHQTEVLVHHADAEISRSHRAGSWICCGAPSIENRTGIGQDEADRASSSEVDLPAPFSPRDAVDPAALQERGRHSSQAATAPKRLVIRRQDAPQGAGEAEWGSAPAPAATVGFQGCHRAGVCRAGDRAEVRDTASSSKEARRPEGLRRSAALGLGRTDRTAAPPLRPASVGNWYVEPSAELTVDDQREAPARRRRRHRTRRRRSRRCRDRTTSAGPAAKTAILLVARELTDRVECATAEVGV